jgi:WD40 repeat protein
LFTLLGHTDIIDAISFSPDGSMVASSSDDGTIRLWSTTLRNEVGAWAGDLLATNTDATHLATFKLGGGLTIQTWDAAKDSPFAASRLLSSVTLPISGDAYDGVGISPDFKYLATGQNDGTVQIWDATSGKQLLSFKGHPSDAFLNRYSSDSTRILTTSYGDLTAKVWDIASALKTGTPPTHELISMSGHGNGINDAAFSPDGKRIATGTTLDGLIRIWDEATGKELMTLSGHTSSIFALAFSPDSEHLVSGSRDLTAKIWDVETGKELFTLRGHQGQIRSVAFSPDGKVVATAGNDDTTKVWDSATGAQLLSFATPGNPFNGDTIAFNPDGTRLFVDEGADGVRAYVLPIEDLLQLVRLRVTRTLTMEECQQFLHVERCPAN